MLWITDLKCSLVWGFCALLTLPWKSSALSSHCPLALALDKYNPLYGDKLNILQQNQHFEPFID
jgi:hypothetical protein